MTDNIPQHAEENCSRCSATLCVRWNCPDSKCVEVESERSRRRVKVHYHISLKRRAKRHSDDQGYLTFCFLVFLFCLNVKGTSCSSHLLTLFSINVNCGGLNRILNLSKPVMTQMVFIDSYRKHDCMQNGTWWQQGWWLPHIRKIRYTVKQVSFQPRLVEAKHISHSHSSRCPWPSDFRFPVSAALVSGNRSTRFL